MVALILSVFLCIAEVSPDAIVGMYWSPEKEGKIQIYKRGGRYYGKIALGSEAQKDIKNPDPKLRDRDVIGMEFLKDFTFDGADKWEDGTVYDPKSGKTYDCSISLDDQGNLKLRGYVGISLFGRTEVFIRIKE